MRIMKIAFPVILIIYFSGFIVSCKQMRGIIMSTEKKHNIEANINSLGNDTIIVEYMPVSMVGEMEEPIQDTIFSYNGRFSYDTPSSEPILLYLFPKKGEFARNIGKPYRPNEKYIIILLRPADKLVIQGELKDLYTNYTVKGSEFNEQYAEVRSGYIEEKSKAVLIELDLDMLMAHNGEKEQINELFHKRNGINSISRKAKLKYIENNLNNDLSAFFLLSQPFEIVGEYYNKLTVDVRNGLFKNALDQKYITFRKYIKVNEAELNVKEGEIAPDFVLQSISGDFSLRALERRYIVLDFWGSWCPPCISGFPKMKEYYFKYNGSVEFIGIDCNETEEKWLKALQKYDLPWTQVINSSNIDQDVSVMYGIKNFPSKFILDRNKRIVAKFIGETDEFYKKLDELMATK